MEIKYQRAIEIDPVIQLHKELFQEDNQSFFESIKSRDYYKTFVATHLGEPVAYCIISVIVGEAEIINIGTKSAYRNLGIATKLLDYALKNSQASVVFLEVSNTNVPAINLYKQIGFQEYGVRKKYYGTSDAILMKKQMN